MTDSLLPVRPAEFDPSSNGGGTAIADDDQDAEQQQRQNEVDWSIPLDSQERDRLGRRIVTEVRRALEATAARRFNAVLWRQSYEMVPVVQAGQRWQNAAAVPSSLTRTYCAAASSRLNQQLAQAKPPMSVVARDQKAIDAAPYIEDAMAYVLEQLEWTTIADAAHVELSILGNVFIRTTFEEEYRRIPVEEVEHEMDDTLALHAAGAEPLDAYFGGLQTDAQGRVQRYLGWEDRLIYRGVKMAVIPWQDGIVCPPTVRDARDAYGIGEITYLRGDVLKAGVKVGRYIEDAVEKLLHGHGDDPNFADDGYNARYDRLQDEGILPTGGYQHVGDMDDESDALYREYLCYELCWKGDWDGDGIMEWARVTVHYPSGLIIRLQYLPYEHGEPCYYMIPFLPRVNELYGAGIAEVIATYQDADTALVCSYIDHADLALAMNGNYWYTKGAGLKPERQLIQLGQPVQVDDVSQIKQMEFHPMPEEHYKLGEFFKDRMDLVTASSNPSLGQVTDSKKTLGEVQIVQASGNMMAEEMAARVARHWARIWDQVRWLVAQYGDGSEGGGITYRKAAIPGRTITVQGANGQQQQMPVAQVAGQEVPAPQGFVFQQIDASLLRADVDLVPTGLQLMADMQSRLGQATSVMQEVKDNPLTAQNPECLRIAFENYLQAFHYPQLEKMMAAVEQGIAAQQAAQQAQQQMQQQALEAQQVQALAAHASAPMAPGQGGPQPPQSPGGRMEQSTGAVLPGGPAAGGAGGAPFQQGGAVGGQTGSPQGESPPGPGQSGASGPAGALAQPTLYVVTHGDTDFNASPGTSGDRVTGMLDPPLSDQGVQEAHQIAQQLQGLGVTEMWTSPLRRALQTAQVVSQDTGIPITQQAPLLLPWNLGHFQGRPTEQVAPEINRYMEDQPAAPVPGGESFQAFHQRAVQGLSQAMQAAGGGGVLALITHSRDAELYDAALQGGTQRQQMDVEPLVTNNTPTATILKIAQGPDGNWTMTQVNQAPAGGMSGPTNNPAPAGPATVQTPGAGATPTPAPGGPAPLPGMGSA